MSKVETNFFKRQNLSDICEAYLDPKIRVTKEWFKEPFQRYVGEIFHGNIHGQGFYFIDKEDKLFYDGLFYANKLEGYAQVFYNDGCNFQGLFKANTRFGPGIRTYPNGEQDVGLWNGQSLIRLGGVNEKNLMPRLATTSKGQLKLLKYRYLVPVCPKREDIAYDILKRLNASEKILQQSYKLYNLEVDNKRNIFFNKKAFDKNFYAEDEDCTIDIVLSDDEEYSEKSRSEKQEEEAAGGQLDLNMERVKQISQELEIIESKLKIVSKQKVKVKKKVEYCKACCKDGYALVQEYPIVEEEEAVMEEEDISHHKVEEPREEIQFHMPTERTTEQQAAAQTAYLPMMTELPLTTAVPMPAPLPLTAALHMTASMCMTTALPMTTLVSMTTEPKVEQSVSTTEPCITTETKAEDPATKEPPTVQKEPSSNSVASSDTSRAIEDCTIIADANKPESAEQPTEKEQTSEAAAVTRLEYDKKSEDKKSYSSGKWTPQLTEAELAQTGATEEDSFSFESSADAYNTVSMGMSSDIKEYLVETCKCDEEMVMLDLYTLEKELEALTRDELFFRTIKNSLKEKLNKHLEKIHDNTEAKTMKMLVMDILAWNNEEYCMRMLKHSFLHRKSEYMVNFKISDILSGNRDTFGDPGVHERHCIEFLTACSTGDTDTIFDHVKKNHINVNVCDAKGNNGLFFAAANYNTKTIRVLVNLGANLNQENDEGLLPLSLCLLIYLACKNGVVDWEKSFLTDVEPIIEQQEAFNWYPNVSLLNILAKRERSTEVWTSPSTNDDPYIFDTRFICPSGECPSDNQYESFVDAQRRSIEDSISTLLSCGADPNIGEAPFPPLILALFTEEVRLVESILDARADVNITIKEHLTSLHIIASRRCIKENFDICCLLLAHNCDPRLKTDPTHWPEQKKVILGKDINPDSVEDCGKNPLHILCMRRDFQNDYCNFFQQMVACVADSDIDCGEKYLGHTPLSLAVLCGNQSIVETLIKLSVVDPHQLLDNDMGNVLTLYILKRYEDQLPPNAKDILKCLIDFDVNPLNSVGSFENAIAFMENEHRVVVKEPIMKDKKGKKTKEKSKESSKKSKKNEKEKENFQETIKDYLKELSRKTIMKSLRVQAVENLYNIIEEKLITDDSIQILAEILTPFEAITRLQMLFQYGKIKQERLDNEINKQLLDMVIASTKENKLKQSASQKEGLRKSKTNLKSQTNLEPKKSLIQSSDYAHILDMTDFKKLVRIKSKYMRVPPGLDNLSKYKVCFHCLVRTENTLIPCPRCQMIYFCSENCNKENLKLKTGHTCNILFYGSELKRLESPEASELAQGRNLNEFFNEIRENCRKRWEKKLKEQKELEKKRFEEEMKADVYGTKRLRWIREGQGVHRQKNPTLTTLLGSDIPQFNGFNVNEQSVSPETTYESVGTRTVSKKPLTVPEKISSDEKYSSMVNKRHDSSLIEFPTIEDGHRHSCLKKYHRYDCGGCNLNKIRGDSKCRCEQKGISKMIAKRVKIKTEEVNAPTMKKLRKIPDRYQKFIELLSQYFPDVDFSSLFLPYACYSNGHLYYKFLDKDFYTRTYSMM